MDNNVYLNIGGKQFVTNIDTLTKCQYFNAIVNINGNINSSQEKPYFIDRDPKIFRHVLNLLRDSNYNFPEKYSSELDFYGLYPYETRENGNDKKTDTNKMFIFDADNNLINNSQRANSNIIQYNKIPESIYITQSPQITFLKSVYRRHTLFEPPRVKNYLFNTNKWKHIVRGDFSLVGIELLIPAEFIDKLEYFTIFISYGTDTFSFNLGFVKYVQKIIIKDDFLSINLKGLIWRDYLYIYKLLEDKKSFAIGLEYNLQTSEITSVLKLSTVRAIDDYNNFSSICREHLIYELNSHKFVGNEFKLPVGLIVYIVFNVNYDYVTLEYINSEDKIDLNHSYTISKFDARYSYKAECPDSEEFPDDQQNWGLISFRLHNLFDDQPCGHLESDDSYKIKFHTNNINEKEEGIIWICQYRMLHACPTKITDKSCDLGYSFKKLQDDLKYYEKKRFKIL